MSKAKELNEKLNTKPENTKVKSILESVKKVQLVEWLPKEQVTELKKKVKTVFPKGWKGSLSWDKYGGGTLTVKIQGVPLKDAKEMAYNDLEEYKKVNGVSSLRYWDNKYQLRTEFLDLDKKVIDKSFGISVQPVSSAKELTEAYILERIKHKIKPTSNGAKALAKVIYAALEGGYNNTDSMSDYFDQSHSIDIRFGYDNKTKLL